MSEENEDTFRVITPTDEILRYAESVIFDDKLESSDEILNKTMVGMYGTLVVLGIAGYDADQLKKTVSDAVDTAYPMIEEVRTQFQAMIKGRINR